MIAFVLWTLGLSLAFAIVWFWPTPIGFTIAAIVTLGALYFGARLADEEARIGRRQRRAAKWFRRP